MDLGLWNDPGFDPDTATSGSLYLPIGPWATVSDPAQSKLLEDAGKLTRQVILNIHRAYHASLRKHGLPQDVLDEWSEKVEDGKSLLIDTLPVVFEILQCSILSFFPFSGLL